MDGYILIDRGKGRVHHILAEQRIEVLRDEGGDAVPLHVSLLDVEPEHVPGGELPSGLEE